MRTLYYLTLPLALLCAPPALAQIMWPAAAPDDDVRGAVRFTAAAALKYLDEPWEFAGAASLRFYLTSRLSLEPEVVVSPGRRFNQWSFIPNLAFDLRDRGARVTPYVIGGIGYFHEKDKSIDYKRSGLAWSAGLGLRVRLPGRLFLAPEFRAGHMTRAAIGFGILF
ncbi:MAG: hypothetical protein KIT09_14480 [Bryobacteraceae bacterium]|nr:hypothetical protein [Bryobacteraceae bacterium]